jgi:transposase
MNSQLRNIQELIRPQVTGPGGPALDLLLNLCSDQQNQIKSLEARIKTLEDQANQNSGNSSKPPSTDNWRSPKKRSLRKSSGKPRGGQTGHKGEGGKISDTPDQIIPFSLDQCPACQHDLSEVSSISTKVKQLVELPVVKPQVTEYQIEVKCCPGCARQVQAPGCPIDHQMEFGPRIKAFCVYLSAYQLVPCKRTSELLSGLLGVSISTGSLDNFRQLASRLLGPFMEKLKQTILAAQAAYFDETGIRVDGKRFWGHTASTDLHTFYGLDKQRGGAAHDRMNILPGFSGVAHHDALPAYNVFNQATHRLCNAHSLRELNGVIDREGKGKTSNWAASLKRLLCSAKAKVDLSGAGVLSTELIAEYHKKYKLIVARGLTHHPARERPPGKKRGRVKQSKTHNLLSRLRDREKNYLLFISEAVATFDNNQAERDLRMLKVKMKISGCFRSMKAGQEFFNIRSFVSTAIKQVVDPIELLVQLFSRKNELIMQLAKLP